MCGVVLVLSAIMSIERVPLPTSLEPTATRAVNVSALCVIGDIDALDPNQALPPKFDAQLKMVDARHDLLKSEFSEPRM